MTMPDVSADLEAAAQRVRDLSDKARDDARKLRPGDLGGLLLRDDQTAQELTEYPGPPLLYSGHRRPDNPVRRRRAATSWAAALGRRVNPSIPGHPQPRPTPHKKEICMISGKTTVIAHLGYPTFAFKAPMIYNPWFEKNDIDAVVLPMGVKPEEYREFFPLLFKMS